MEKQTPAPSSKLPYRTPVLQVFGAVRAITATLAMGGTTKDGGPNNTKS